MVDSAVQGQQFSDIIENQLYHCIIDGLLVQFFPEPAIAEPYNKEDVVFFIKIANDEVPLVQQLSTQFKILKGKFYDSINLSKFKSFFDKILSRGWSNDGGTFMPLNLYKYEV